MTGAWLFIGFLVLQRIVELFHSKRNTARLLSKGAREIAANHYPLLVLVHVAWLIAIAILGHEQSIEWLWLVLYGALQVFRLWILASLGSRWTTRIIVLDEPLVARGPYRFLRHPNYILVAAEIFVAPMVLGLFWVAIVFSVFNALALMVRIPAEEQALGIRS